MDDVLEALREAVRAKEAFWKACDVLYMAVEAECGLKEATDINDLEEHVDSIAATCDNPDEITLEHAAAFVDECKQVKAAGF